MAGAIKLLILEDKEEDAILLIYELKRAGYLPEWKRVDCQTTFLDGLEEHWDIILADYALPQFDGLQALEYIKLHNIDIPFILVSGSMGEEIAVEAMKMGANDYLLKDRLARLPSAVQHALDQNKLQREKTRLEAALLQNQKMEAVGKLAGGIAHDFNNLLTIIIGSAELAESELANDHPVQKRLNTIQHASERAVGIIKQLLTFARKPLVHTKESNVKLLLAETCQLLIPILADQTKVNLINETDQMVKVDPGQLQQVLINLAINARDAMPAGGQIDIQTGTEVVDLEYVVNGNSIKPGEYVTISIRDSGQGIPYEIQSRVFDPFFTTKDVGKGTGLGLAISYDIVSKCGGFISLVSQPGAGSNFTIHLPKIDSSIGHTPMLSPHNDKLIGHECLLLVDDEEQILEMVSEVLINMGYRVLTAKSGLDAISVFENCGSKIDLLVTDLSMPGMGGLELANELQRRDSSLKVLFITGYHENFEQGHNDKPMPGVVLEKPFSNNLLGSIVREVLAD